MNLPMRQNKKRNQALDAFASLAKTWSEWRLGERATKTVAKGTKKASKSADEGTQARAKAAKNADASSVKNALKGTPLKVAGAVALVGGDRRRGRQEAQGRRHGRAALHAPAGARADGAAGRAQGRRRRRRRRPSWCGDLAPDVDSTPEPAPEPAPDPEPEPAVAAADDAGDAPVEDAGADADVAASEEAVARRRAGAATSPRRRFPTRSPRRRPTDVTDAGDAELAPRGTPALPAEGGIEPTAVDAPAQLGGRRRAHRASRIASCVSSVGLRGGPGVRWGCVE